MIRLSAAVAVLFAAALQAAAGTAPTVEAKVTTSRVSVGEPFTVVVSAAGPPGTVFAFPKTAGDARVELEAVPETTSPDPATQRYQGAAYALDKVAVPPVTVTYRLADGTEGEVATTAVPLDVVSLLEPGRKSLKLEDVRPPVGIPLPAWFWFVVAALLAAAAAALAVVLRRRRAPVLPEAAAIPALPPEEEALAALEALRRSPLLGQGELKPYYVELTLIAKRYLERRLAGPVLEMTSAETSSFLRRHPVGREVASQVREITSVADHVKFARGAAERVAAASQIDAVAAIVRHVETRAAAIEAEATERTA